MPGYTKNQLNAFTADRRYWDKKHPEHQAHLDFTVKAFDETYPDPLVPTKEQEEWAARENLRLRELSAKPAYWNNRHPDHARALAEVTRGYDKLNAVLYGSPGPDDQPPASFAPAVQATQTAQTAQAPAAPRPVHQVNPPPPADPQQRYPNPNAMRETEDERAQRKINQENWESQRRDQGAPQLANRAPEEQDDDPTHWWRMPVEGGRIREIDAQGEGHFGARRVRPSGPAGHGGIDIEAAPGAQVVSPVDGVVKRVELGPEGQTGRNAIVIETEDGHQFRILYVARDTQLRPGTQVMAGRTPIGAAVDNQRLYPGARGMTNHIHMEVHKDGRARNPRPFVRRD